MKITMDEFSQELSDFLTGKTIKTVFIDEPNDTVLILSFDDGSKITISAPVIDWIMSNK